jgi:hypothetical protein
MSFILFYLARQITHYLKSQIIVIYSLMTDSTPQNHEKINEKIKMLL